MTRRSLIIIILIFCFGLILMGCPKKTVVKEEPSVQSTEELTAERAAKEKEAREKEEGICFISPAELNRRRKRKQSR